MGRLLNREQVYLISEKAVDVSQSASGVLANLAMKPISLLIGSIKKHYRKQQLDALIMQWAGEYAKAVKPELEEKPSGEPVSAQDATDTEVASSSGEIPNIDDVTKIPADQPEVATKNIIAELQKDIASLSKIQAMVKKLPSNGIMDDTIFRQFKKEFGELETLYFEEYMNDLKGVVAQEDLDAINANIKTYNTFIEALYNAPNAAKVKQVFQSTFKQVYQSKLDEIKIVLVKINQQLKTVLYVLQQKEQKPAEQKPAEQQTDTAATPQAEPKAGDAIQTQGTFLPVRGDKGRMVSTNPAKTGKTNASFSFGEHFQLLTEAKYVIPREPNELISEIDLSQLVKENPKIKEEATKRVNLKRLDILLYEAQFILNKTRTSGAADKPGETNADLQRVWDIGIKKINDYFQSVIDVDSVMKQVKPEADQKKKDQLVKDEAQISNLENMNITEVFKVGEKFDPNKVYAFDCTVTGIKSITTTLLVSPTTKFVDDNSDTTQYWFKLLGAYRYDEKSKKTMKINIFKSIVSNQKIINNNTYHYLAMRNLRPSTNSGSYAFLYSNFGNIYYNNEEYKDTAVISKELTDLAGQGKFRDKEKNLMKTGNSLRIKMHQRFFVDDKDIQAGKFPGIDAGKINDDKNIDKSKKNNQLLMDILESDI